MGPELGILLADAAMLPEALARCQAAPERTQLFLMDDGVRVAADRRLYQLLEAGAEVALCAMDAEARGVRPQDGGPSFGSQHDHARMVRDAGRLVAMTGAGIDDHVAQGPRTVLVRLTQPTAHPKSGQALRSAVAYAASGLSVTVALASPLLGSAPAPAARALATLRALDALVVAGEEPPPAALQVTW